MSKTRRSPDGMWATGGAVSQHDGMLPIYICNNCEHEVVWATSKRTGRKYLANIHHGANGWRYYIGASIHKCEPITHPDNLDAEEFAAREYALWQRATAASEAVERGDTEAARRILSGDA